MLLCTARASQVPSSKLGSYYSSYQLGNSKVLVMSANQQREAGNAEAKEALDEPEDVRIPSFEPKEIEGFKLVAVDSRSAAIQWKPVVQLDGTESLDGESPTSAPEPAWSITYSLELQERQASYWQLVDQ